MRRVGRACCLTRDWSRPIHPRYAPRGSLAYVVGVSRLLNPRAVVRTGMSNVTETDSDVTLEMLRRVIRKAGLSDRLICLHSSLSSFGRVDGGAATIVDAFLAQGCTLLVPTFSWDQSAVAPDPDAPRPGRNGSDYDSSHMATPSNPGDPYTPESNALDLGSMGRVPAAVLSRTDRARGSHPLCSFAAVGPLASKVVDGQTAEDVFAPLRVLTSLRGAVVLAGVDLTTMTLIHLAEQMSGRRMFVRWARTTTGTIHVRVGGCSSGFEKLSPILASIERVDSVGLSCWRVFDAAQAAEAICDAIATDPWVTHCADPHCIRCSDAILGGPEW